MSVDFAPSSNMAVTTCKPAWVPADQAVRADAQAGGGQVAKLCTNKLQQQEVTRLILIILRLHCLLPLGILQRP